MTGHKKLIISFLIFFEIVIFAGVINIYFAPGKFSILLKVIELVFVLGMFFLLYKCKLKKQFEDRKYSIISMFLFSLLANYKIIYLYVNNIREIPFYIFLPVLTAGIALFFLCYYLLKFFIRKRNVSIFISIILLFFLHFSLFSASQIKVFEILNIDYYILIAAVLCVALLIKTVDISKVLDFSKRVIVILLIFSCFNLISDLFKYRFGGFFEFGKSINLKSDKIPVRDIYFILLDMYSGKDTLDSLNFDNSEFYTSLKERGFEVHENFSSNYNKTTFSIPSVLNGDYIEDIPASTPSDSIDRSLMFNLARKNGYKICYLNSWPSQLNLKPEYYYKIYNSDKVVVFNSLSAFVKGSVLENLISIKALPEDSGKDRFIGETLKIKGKKLVFLHLLMPHEPYLYDENGNPNQSQALSDFSYSGKHILNSKSYLGYLKYANKYTLDLVDSIWKSSSDKPIIVIFGDHGIRRKYSDNGGKIISDDKDILNIYFNTFLAYYNPDRAEKAKAKSLVNFFRVFINDVFGTSLQELEDKKFYNNYYSPDMFKEVTHFRVQ